MLGLRHLAARDGMQDRQGVVALAERRLTLDGGVKR
ncbi:hypothetical protein NONI108955_17895 [Nocardia ninae]